MKNNNQQDFNTPQQPPINPIPPAPKKFSNTVIALSVLVVIAAVAGYVALNQQPKVKPVFVNQNPTPTPTPTPISTVIDFNKSITLVPADWGKVVKTDNYSDYQGKISNVYIIDFANNVSVIYDEGVELMVYSKVKEQGKCADYYKRFGTHGLFGYGDTETCYITENGIYNLNTKNSVVLKQDLPFAYDARVQASSFSFFDNSGKKVTAIFSPQGKYFAQEVPAYEGCAMKFVDTATGKAVLQNQRIEGRHIEIGSAFSCHPLIDFSKDEKTFTVRVIYAGMTSPGTQFSVIQGEKQWEILSELISKEFDFSTEEVNPVDDFKVISVNDNGVKFDIIKDTSYYKKGSYIFTLSTEKITKQ